MMSLQFSDSFKIPVTMCDTYEISGISSNFSYLGQCDLINNVLVYHEYGTPLRDSVYRIHLLISKESFSL